MSDYEKLAILISIFAIAISFLALGWNIYRDIILKPRLKVRFYISFIIQGEYKSESKLSINATNFGPNKIKLSSISAKNASLLRKIFRRVQYAQIIEDYTDQYSTRLPCELDAGDTCKLFLPFSKDCFLSESLNRICITDTYGRTHWAPKKDIHKAKKKYKERFGQNNT